MERKLTPIPFEEFADHLTDIFEQVVNEQMPVLVESQSGELVEVRAVRQNARQRKFTAEDDAAFLSAAGSWADVDVDEFLKDIYESRQSSRPPVDLDLCLVTHNTRHFERVHGVKLYHTS